MIISIQSPPRLPIMHNQTSLTYHRLSCSGWGREHVFLDLGYNRSQLIQKGEWRTNVNILRFAVKYRNATIIRKAHNTEPEIATNVSNQTRQIRWVDMYGSGFSPRQWSDMGFWTVFERITPFLWADSRSLVGFHGPHGNTNHTAPAIIKNLYTRLPSWRFKNPIEVMSTKQI
jgi:hypothetical protein